jgi:protein tyrosine phosphatase
LIHIWYKNWPDQGVPQIDDFYKFIIYCNHDIKKREGGTVIHCSGGIGRTGTVYVILKIINMFDYDKSLKDKAIIGNKINKNYIASLIGKIVLEARHHRPQMVERVEQYIAIYQVIMKYLDNNFELKDINRGSFYIR